MSAIVQNDVLTNLELDGDIDRSLLGPNGEVDVDKLAKQYRDIVVSSTALYQKEFEEWYKKLMSVPKEDVAPYLDFSYEGWTLENQLPSLFAEVPDPAKHVAEVDELNRKIECINEVFRKYHKDAAIKVTAYKQQMGLK